MNPLYQNSASMVHIINWLHQDYHYPLFVHLYKNALNFLGSIVKIHKTKKPKLSTIDIIYNIVDISGNAF